ncbi:MAG: hypothetical protein ACKPHF_02910, partial [Dolichospermum sp.]
LRDVNPQSFYSDWGNVPPVNHFFGRTQELQKLKQWIINERCRVLAIGCFKCSIQSRWQVICRWRYQ